MLIDPFIVIAQIINFLILVVLLKRFLYQPITKAMEARAQRIERQLEEAERLADARQMAPRELPGQVAVESIGAAVAGDEDIEVPVGVDVSGRERAFQQRVRARY